MADFSIKAHDLLPSIQAVLKNPDGSPLDLTAATGIKFIMRATTGGTIKVTAAAVKADAVNGVVRYDWSGTDTATIGAYQGEWEITWPGGKKQTVPTLTYHSIEILADLDNA